MRWVKAALVLVLSTTVGIVTYLATDNLAVPAALVSIGVIIACMTVALAGDGGGSAPVPNPRAASGEAMRSAAPDRRMAASAPAPAGWPGQAQNPDAAAWHRAQRR